jgi:CheY-like chemotaxis protein
MRIALIEDAPGDVGWFRVVLAETLSSHNLFVFPSGGSALEHFEKNEPPELIVSDWMLPGMEFPEFLKHVRAIPQCESTPVAVCSGLADYYSDKALKLGAVCCLQKPIDAVQLQTVFQRIGPSAQA